MGDGAIDGVAGSEAACEGGRHESTGVGVARGTLEFKIHGLFLKLKSALLANRGQLLVLDSDPVLGNPSFRLQLVV